MADLIDRLAGEGDRPGINVHAFYGAVVGYARGGAAGVTRAEFAAAFDLQGDEATQATTLANVIDSYAQWYNKTAYCDLVHGVAMMIQDNEVNLLRLPDGTLDKTRIKGLLGI